MCILKKQNKIMLLRSKQCPGCFICSPSFNWTSLVAQMVKRLPHCSGRPGFSPWGKKISWGMKWQPTSVFLPGESHGWRSLTGYSPRGCKESDMTEQFYFLLFIGGWAQTSVFFLVFLEIKFLIGG